MQAPPLHEAPKQWNYHLTVRVYDHKKRKLYDHEKKDRSASGKKLHQLKVKISGEIDAGCDGKNAWVVELSLHVPRVLDISIIDLDVQKPESL
jgi:hypothetical protein